MFIDPNKKNNPEYKNVEHKKPHLNLNIDKIFINGDEKEEAILKGNQAAFVVSQEIALNTNQIGFLSSKNKFDEKGLLTICSKTVHPGYSGRVSAQFINIHNEPVSLRRADSFLELMLYENEEKFSEFPQESKKSDNGYLESIKRRSLKYPVFFLNIDVVKKEILEELNTHGWGFIKTFSITLAIVSALAAVATGWFSYWTTNSTFSKNR